MPEKMELSTDMLNRVKQSATNFKDSVATYIENHEVSIKDWKFAVENSENNYIVDVSVKLLIKSKSGT